MLCLGCCVFVIFTRLFCNANHVPNTSVCETFISDSVWEVINKSGSCEPYMGTFTGRSSPCDEYFTEGVDLVYIPNSRANGNQSYIRDLVEDLGEGGAIEFLSQSCQVPIVRSICLDIYLPCGRNGIYHAPRVVCPEVCRYLSETLCPTDYQRIELLIDQLDPDFKDDLGFDVTDCSSNQAFINEFLDLEADCCSDAGVIIPSFVSSERTIMTPSASVSNSQQPNSQNNDSSVTIIVVVVIVTVAVLFAILLVVIGAAVLFKKNLGKDSPTPSSYQTNVEANHYATQNSTIQFPHQHPQEIPRIPSFYLTQMSDIIIDKSKIKLLELIGQGEFGVVYHAVLHKGTVPQAVAVKTLKGSFDENQFQGLIEETLKMKKFDHFNVLPLIGICLDLQNEAPCIVMPYMSEGSLLSYLMRERPKLSIAENASVDDDFTNNVTKQLLSMCLQVAKGMEYLSGKKFVHRDLAARNCMMSIDGVIKVADFGLTEDVYVRNYFRLKTDSDSEKKQVKLPVKWMALESIHDGLFTEKTDVWSFGILCWEVFNAGKTPYPGMSPREVIDFIDSGERLDKPKNKACNREIFNFIVSCWNQSPDQRMSFVEIVSSLNELIEPLADYFDILLSPKLTSL